MLALLFARRPEAKKKKSQSLHVEVRPGGILILKETAFTVPVLLDKSPFFEKREK
jgi:hypothetical protein